MRISDKIQEIEIYLSELLDILPENFEEYKDKKTKAACERYSEKIITAVIDLAFLVIKEKSFKVPEEDKEAFEILATQNVITNQLSEKLKEAKGMRNILAHQYGQIDDKIVFDSIKNELEGDIKEFMNKIKKFLR